MNNLHNYKLTYEDLPDYNSILARLKVYRLRRTLEKRKRGK